MYLTRLLLANFRNYLALELDLGPGTYVFQGDNAQGKSNLLEAAYFLATTRSARASSDRELINWLACHEPVPFARLEAAIQRESGELHVEIIIRREPDADGPGEGAAPLSKTIRVNGLPVRASQLVGQVNMVLFSPEDVGLVAGPPVARRRYLDITNSQVKPLYLRTLQRYHRVLLQRNHLLRQVRERRQPRELLDFWSDELASAGGYLVAQRLRMLGVVNRALEEIHPALTGTRQRLEIVYRSSVLEGAGTGPGSSDRLEVADEQDLVGRLRERMRVLADRELAHGASLVGPHRDDLAFLVDGMDLNLYGSRGQQRLAALALKLAEAGFMLGQTGERPILLLDDVLSELDSSRRRYVLEAIRGDGQVLITSTDLEPFHASFLGAARVFRIRQGTVLADTVATR